MFLLQTNCRLCSIRLTSIRINLLTAEFNGFRLVEIANKMLGLNIVGQNEGGGGMDACLACAGKLVDFENFREACHSNERSYDTIFTAIQLKTMFNQSQQPVGNDDDMQVIYVCRHCKEQFENNAEYLEHKKLHNPGGNWLTSTPSKDTSHTTDNDLNGSKRDGNLNLQVKVEEETIEDRVPPLVLKKAGARQLRSKLRVLKASDVLLDHENDEDYGAEKKHAHRKQVKCEKCQLTFSNFKAKWWHDLKKHKILVAGAEKRKRNGRQVCRYCHLEFDQYIQKYRHEKRCQGTEQGAAGVVELQMGEIKVESDYKAKCSLCNAEFSTRRAKTMHEKLVHSLDIRECRVCHKLFSSYPGRYIHEKRCGLKQAQVEA